ncbi:MAG: DUF502 domain-containing protein [Gammaproteobacteria bacterium]|nr:DUF502 domain-containing protein [Gammaproteobacteria bacterium]
MKQFVITAALGGFFVILPLLVLFKLLVWLLAFFSNTVSPWTRLLMQELDISRIPAELSIFILLFAFCFMLGAFVRTRWGGWVHDYFERHLLARIPGYLPIKDIIKQFSGSRQGVFRKVVRVSMSDNQKGPFLTGMVTDEYQHNRVTVFVPTGPNPTTGLILHTSVDNVVELDVSVEAAMKTIISCGAGSGNLLNALKASNG